LPPAIQERSRSTSGCGHGWSHGIDPSATAARIASAWLGDIVVVPEVEGELHRVSVSLTEERLDVGGETRG
jgi:hypothetical protein